jgi:hypothetical protein
MPVSSIPNQRRGERMTTLGTYLAAPGPNTKRLREMENSSTLAICVSAGPGDLMEWDVSATIDDHGLPVRCIGRGRDLEDAAGALHRLLTEAGARLQTPDDSDAVAADGDGVLGPE